LLKAKTESRDLTHSMLRKTIKRTILTKVIEEKKFRSSALD